MCYSNASPRCMRAQERALWTRSGKGGRAPSVLASPTWCSAPHLQNSGKGNIGWPVFYFTDFISSSPSLPGYQRVRLCLISLALKAPSTVKDMEESPVALLSEAGGSFLIPSYLEGGNSDICKILSWHRSRALEAITVLHYFACQKLIMLPSPDMGFQTNWRGSQEQKENRKKYNNNFLNITSFTCRCH